MNKVESTLLEQMDNKLFQDVISDDFAFADSLVDNDDLNKLNIKEVIEDGSDD